MFGFLRNWRRRRHLRRARLDPEPWGYACKTVRCILRMPPHEVEELRRLVTLFLYEKDFYAAEGFALDDRHRYAIALQACVVILHLGIDAYADWSSIHVFPGAFRSRHPEPGAIAAHSDYAGLAVQGGGVALAWTESEHGMRDADDGYNPVIHEFAHKLDMIDGAADGRPALPGGVTQQEWGETFQRAFAEFRSRLDRGAPTELNSYAATNAAEFFAVLSEVYFEQPEVLADEFPDVLHLLRAFYRGAAA